VLSLIASLMLAQATVIEDPKAADGLMGEHIFNLQWISQPPGRARVTEEPKGELRLTAAQKNIKGEFVTVDGRITKVTTKTFELEGTVRTSVGFVNGGKLCEKSGRFTFRITGTRQFWRLKEMNNCEGNGVVDYVDLYFARPR
jgi:hypothetical protein